MIIQIDSISKNELKDLISEVVNNAISKIQISEPSSKESDLLNRSQLMEYLSCSHQKIHLLMRNGNFPYKKIGRRVYFRKSEVDNYMKSFNQ